MKSYDLAKIDEEIQLQIIKLHYLMAGCDKKGMDHTWQPDPRCQKLKRGQVFSVTVKMIKVPYAFLYQLTMNFIVFSEGSLKI